jgi:tetraacyldisaccharide 4'-kinase
LQNPTLRKTLSLLIIDGASGFGNGHLLPVGPLRERIGAAAARCQAAILIGPDRTGALRSLPPLLPVLRAELRQHPDVQRLRGRRLLAFAGIARPAKFFDSLADAGVDLVETVPFGDHHVFTARELDRLLARASAVNATLVTTPKDAVRLPPGMRAGVAVVDVSLVWQDPDVIDSLLRSL